jgi:glycolate oxidase FAD binding subunit
VSLAELEQSLAALLPADTLLANIDAYAVEGQLPSLAVRPDTEEQVLDVLREADSHGAAVVPWGGGSQMSLGMPLARYGLALDLTALSGVIEYEPADLTVSVQAGMRLADLQRALGENNQWLPLDPIGAEQMTVGGMLASNASGPGRAVYGTPRDFLIGIAVAMSAGDLVRSGGRVVKNVAGYDLGKLHIGVLGTLGVITRASFKVAPLPEVVLTLAAASTEFAPLQSLATFARRRGLSLNRLCLLRPGGSSGWRLLVRMAGGAAAVAASIGHLQMEAASSGIALDNADESSWQELESLLTAGDVTVKAAVPPSATGKVLDALLRLDAGILSYPTAGIAYGTWPAGGVDATKLRELRNLCTQERGSLVIERAPVDLKLAADVWGEARPDLQIMQRLKDQFDPKHTLNPGRFVAGI